jgi:hypothetical protein
VGFSGFLGVSVIFGTAVMARRTGRRDHGMPGIPREVADSGAGVARGERPWPECGRCRRDSRHARRGRARGEDDRDFGEVIKPSGRVFENTHDLAGDLLRAKNAGVAPRAYFINSGAIPRRQLLKSATRGNLKSTS